MLASVYAQEKLAVLDNLFSDYKIDEGIKQANQDLSSASRSKEKAEILWRIARFYNQAGFLEEQGSGDEDKALSLYESGLEAADKAIAADPGNGLGYFWRAGNVGRIATINGIMDSLSKAKPMRDDLLKVVELDPDFVDSYFVLGQMYEQVPGGLMFGDKVWAVSYGYYTLALYKEQIQKQDVGFFRYDYNIQLARHLYARGWSLKKRLKEWEDIKSDYNKASSPNEKARAYEAQVKPTMDDKEEALTIISDVFNKLEGQQSSLNIDQQAYAKEARMLLKEWS